MNEKDRDGWTPLHSACVSGDTLAAIALIERGAILNEKNQHGDTSLHRACYNGHTATAVALIERGASVNEKDEDGWTPLHYTCFYSHSATAILLLENRAVCVNDRNCSAVAPSYWACLRCTTDVVLRLIRHGAILTADLQHFRDQSTVTEEQARTVEDAYKRQDNWRRRAHYAMFLSSIRDLVDVEHEPGPSAAANSGGGGGGVGRRTRAATQARLMRAVDKVLCGTNTERLIGSFL